MWAKANITLMLPWLERNPGVTSSGLDAKILDILFSIYTSVF